MSVQWTLICDDCGARHRSSYTDGTVSMARRWSPGWGRVRRDGTKKMGRERMTIIGSTSVDLCPLCFKAEKNRRSSARLPQLKICANETCGKEFRWQEGRATQGQNHATGVIYCSPQCAKAQVQREYRRRKRSA